MDDVAKFGRKLKRSTIFEEDVCIEGPVFSLHCKVTPMMLLFATAVVSSKEMLGKPLTCMTDRVSEYDYDLQSTIETFCWANSTFLPYLENGVEKRTYHAYYQWVHYALVLQAVFFYLPRVLWTQWERNLMEYVKGYDNQRLLGREERMERRTKLVDFFVNRLECTRAYAVKYWLCECLCFVNVLAQMFALDKFFHGDYSFLTYGLSAFKLVKFKGDSANAVFNFPGQATLDYIFPIRTRCTFYKYGPSGSIMSLDSICILAINNVNRYIYLIMWYWFVTLIVLHVLLFVYRLAYIFSARLRCKCLSIPGRGDSTKQISQFLVHRLSVTDWWMLDLLRSNINSVSFKDLVIELYVRMSWSKARKKMLYHETSSDEAILIRE